MTSAADAPFTPVLVQIDLGTFVGAAGERTGPWRYFLSYVEADGCQCCMGDCSSYYQALLDAQDLTADGGLPIVDLTDEVVG